MRMMEDGHIVWDDDGKLYIIDTGSPTTFGDRAGWPDRCWAGDAKYISSLLGYPINGLVGMDNLRSVSLKISPDRNLFEVNVDDFPFDPDDLFTTVVPYKPFQGATPTVGIEVDGVKTLAMVDTGAVITYVPRSFAKGKKKIGKHKDFYPSIGHFETDLVRAEIIIDDMLLDEKVAVLPSRLGIPVPILGNSMFTGDEAFYNTMYINTNSKLIVYAREE